MWWAGRAQLELSPGLPANPPVASESALFSPHSIDRRRQRVRAGSMPRCLAGSFTWSTARQMPSVAAAGAAEWSRWRRQELQLCLLLRGPWYVLVPTPPGSGGMQLGFPGLFRADAEEAGAPGQNCRWNIDQVLWLQFLWSCMWRKGIPVSVFSCNKTAPFFGTRRPAASLRSHDGSMGEVSAL